MCHALGRSERRAKLAARRVLRHQACLKNIARLEKELGIGQDASLDEWQVESVQYVEVRRPYAIMSNLTEG